MNLQRYDLDAESSSMGGYVEMRPCNVVGEWVKASEAEAEIAAKDARIKELEHRFEEIKFVLSRGRDATGCSDEYFRGMYNGIEWSLCCIEERDANYKDVCEKAKEDPELIKLGSQQ